MSEIYLRASEEMVDESLMGLYNYDVITSDSYNFIFTGKLMFLLFQTFSSLPKTLDALLILIVQSVTVS